LGDFPPQRSVAAIITLPVTITSQQQHTMLLAKAPDFPIGGREGKFDFGESDETKTS
jgi:hypothetical protein